MVRRVFRFVYQEIRGLHQAAYVLALFALGSQMLALVRDRMLASQFGADTELDLYYAAFKVPDLLYVLFASVLSVYVLLPFVRSRVAAGGDEAGQQLLQSVFTAFLFCYAGAALVLFWVAPYLVPSLFPGLAEQSDELVMLVRILLLQPFLLALSSLFGVVTQMYHRFILYAVSPLLYNVGIIIGIVWLYPWLGLPGLAVGVVLGAVMHLLVQVPIVQRSELSFGVRRSVSLRDLWQVVVVAVPRGATLTMNQLVLLVLVSIASVMAVGSVSVFQFAFNLQSVPLAVVGVSYSVAAFPTLSRLWVEERWVAFADHILTALRHIIFWSVPIIALIIVLRAQIVRVVLGGGAFDWDDTRLTAAVLALLAISLTAHAMYLVLVRAFYAGGYTRLPLLVTSVGVGVTITLAYGLHYLVTLYPHLMGDVSTLLRVGDVPGNEVLVLAIAYTVGMLVQVKLLAWFAMTRLGLRFYDMFQRLLRAIVAAFVGGMVAYATLNFIVDGVNPERFLGIFLQGFVAGVAGMIGAALAYAALRAPELTEIASAIQIRIGRPRSYPPGDTTTEL